jgi:two-component system, OmpR family, response regulator
MTCQRTVLVVEDDQSLLDALATTLRNHGYRVQGAKDGDAALALSGEQSPDIAIVDMLLPGKSGFYLTQQLKDSTEGRIIVVMISSNASTEHQDYALSTGVDRFLAKPFAAPKILEIVEELCPPRPTAKINGTKVTPRPPAMLV